jgi:hypothetical protein
MKLYKELSNIQTGGYNTFGTDTNLELYSPQVAGDSEDIWPLITKNWKKTNSLGIRSITNPETINFLFIPNNQDKIDEPILGRGTFTAVYQLKNEHDKSDSTKYILRLFSRDSKLSDKHMIHNEKTMNEYKLYEKYLIKIFYYGGLKVTDQKFKYTHNNQNMNLDNYEFIPNTKKEYNFDHIITKIYKMPVFDKNYYIVNLTNLQKYLFLYNNVVMLNELFKNKSFHADYKIGNVGWDNSKNMNVILIDYDIDTIQHVDKLNTKIIINNGIVTSIRFPSTYIPEFIKNGNGIKSVPVDQYLKYSIGGLNNVINLLNIHFTKKDVNLPSNLVKHPKIKKIETSYLSKSLNLQSKNYDDIPDYDEIIAILSWLYINHLIP